MSEFLSYRADKKLVDVWLRRDAHTLHQYKIELDAVASLHTSPVDGRVLVNGHAAWTAKPLMADDPILEGRLLGAEVARLRQERDRLLAQVRDLQADLEKWEINREPSNPGADT